MSIIQPRSRRGAIAILAVTALGLASGCGTHVPHDQIVAAGNGYSATVGGAGGNDSTGASDVGVTSGNGGADGTGGPTASSTGGTSSGATGGIASSSGAAASTAGSTGATATGGTKAPTGSTGGSSTGGNAPCTKSLKPVVLGQTLAASGLIGAQISPMRNGLAVWAKAVNARGGVQCHPVRLYQADDASDPARVSSNWNDLVHNKGAVAVLGAGVPVTIGALRAAAERDKVPVVGGDGNALDWWQSQYLFPQGGHALASYDGASISAAKAAGAKSIGLLYCVEASICTAEKNNFPHGTRKAGLGVGPMKAVSLTQTDYTAECQTMKDAGMKALWVMVDGSAISRVLRSCASLGYRPTVATGAIAIGSAASTKDANIRQNQTFLGSEVAPFTESDTPGGKEFHDAMKRYQPGVELDGSTMMGWTAGKLFEAALGKVSGKARVGDITTQLVLEGLWQLKQETLQGLSPGVSFAKGAASPAVNCYYTIRLSTKGADAPDKSVKRCT